MYARKAGAAWEILAPAKLNLYLDVLGRRDDGFHELETLMAPVQLYDRLEWRPRRSDCAAEFALQLDPSTVSAGGDVPVNEQNLVWKAAAALGREAGVMPHGVITLTKRIPSQAGLGGGSSDAAAALQLCNAAWGVNYSAGRLASLAAELGSDVPFFLAGRSAVCRGRGELVEPVTGMPRLDVVVAAPRVGISTAAAFKELDAPLVDVPSGRRTNNALSQLINDLLRGARAAAGWRMTNALEAAAASLCPLLRRVGTVFASLPCCAHLLTGSGSAYFAVMPSARQARRAAAWLSSLDLGVVYATATCR